MRTPRQTSIAEVHNYVGVVIPFHSIPPFHSIVPFHRSIPSNKDAHACACMIMTQSIQINKLIPPGGCFAKFNAHQIFPLYGILCNCPISYACMPVRIKVLFALHVFTSFNILIMQINSSTLVMFTKSGNGRHCYKCLTT